MDLSIICKKFLLILPIITIILFIISKNLLFNKLFITIIITINFIIIFINFPMLINILHTTPVYYEDLQMISYSTTINTNKLQNIFSILNGTTSAIFLSILFNYIIENINKTDLKL